MMILSGVLAYQDFRYRAVNVWLLVAFGMSTLAIFMMSDQIFWLDLLLNVGYLLFFFLLSMIAMRLVLKKEWNRSIGRGDIVFIFLLTPLFNFQDFVFWMVILMIFSLLTHLIFKKLNIVRNEYIPLVGYMAVLLIGVTIKTLF